MRVIQAIVGVLISVPTLLFFWIGAQTFVRWHERLLAVALTFASLALLALSLTLLARPSLNRAQLTALATTLVLVAIAFALAKSR